MTISCSLGSWQISVNMSDCPLLPLTIGQHSVPAGFDLKVTSINMILHIPLSQAAGRLFLIGRGRVREKENRVCSAPWIRQTQELCGQPCCCCFKWDEFLWWTAGVLFFWQLMAYEGMRFRSSPVWQMEDKLNHRQGQMSVTNLQWI